MSRLNVNDVVQTVLTSLITAFPTIPFGDNVAPKITDKTLPHAILYDLGTMGPWGAMDDAESNLFLDLQVSCIGSRRDVILTLADKIRQHLIRRDATTSNFATALPVLQALPTNPKLHIVDRYLLDNSGISIEGHPPLQVLMYADRYRLAIVPE